MKNIFLLLLVLCPAFCLAQQRDVILYLNNGNAVSGTIVEETQTSIILRDSYGENQQFRKVEIRRMEDIVSKRERVLPPKYKDYSTKVSGFWGAIEIGSGVNLHSTNKYKSSFPTEALVTGGYRFHKYCQVGLGAGVRYYFEGNDRIHVEGNEILSSSHIAFPVFVNARGIFIDDLSRAVVPYWSANVGYTIHDGFYFAPSLGLRIGSTDRHHFLVSLGYSLQCADAPSNISVGGYENIVLNAATLKIGYQF